MLKRYSFGQAKSRRATRTVLLRELDYAEDFDIAELEIELEAEGKLNQFIQTCKKLHGKEWSIVRKGAQKLSRASAVLHELDKKTYPSADSWAHSQRNREAAITVSKVVERTFELWGRRRKGKALAFIIDEVGSTWPAVATRSKISAPRLRSSVRSGRTC